MLKDVWQLLSINLLQGTIVPNWTVLKENLGDSMKVVKVDQDEIIIQSPKAINLQHILRDEFEKVWEIWPAYKNGRIQRQEIREMTFHSKYIISILHWLEVNHK